MLGNMIKQPRFKQPRFKEAILNSQLQDTKVQQAKEYPIQRLYTGELKRTGRILMGSCPFHTDPKPSFAIYTENNTWNCFAKCGGGDVIAFYMKLKGVDFLNAVQELTK